MMSLLALGKELEGEHLQSSLSFFFYNLSLIPIVAAIWLGYQWAALKYYPGNINMADPNRPTIGYSGVLFAWMVVAALEQQSTCPVIFFPSLCFRTYSFWSTVKFSFGPLVQLVVMQLICPRVSFTGHLAGIVAGCLLHWGLLPIRYVQPAILIPALYLVYLRTIRNVLPTITNPAYSTYASERSLNASCESAPRRALLFRCQLAALVCSVAVLGPSAVRVCHLLFPSFIGFTFAERPMVDRVTLPLLFWPRATLLPRFWC